MASTGQFVLEDGNLRPDLTASEILKTVAREFSVSISDLKSWKRTQQVCCARDELCRRLYVSGMSQSEVGKFIGRTPEGAALAIKRAEERLMIVKFDPPPL